MPKTVRIKSSEGETDQSSTSVLATLAALAEASGPLNAPNAPSKLLMVNSHLSNTKATALVFGYC